MILKRIKNKITRVINNYNENKYLNKIILNNDSVYKFKNKDLELYKIEKRTHLPVRNVDTYSNDLKIVTINEHRIFWPTNVQDDDLPWLYHEIFDKYDENPSSYDHPNMNYQKADWIIDAGCCEGYFSLFAFDKSQTCSVIALEPLEEMKEALIKTFEKQINEKRFVLEQKALGKESGTVLFSFNSNHLCDSSMKGSASCLSKNDNNVYDVEVTSLDILVKENDLKENGIVKMDIEGAEMDALLGGGELMKKYKPKLAIAVYHDYENALKCKEIILKANPEYKVEFRGMYGYFNPPRPYILFAW